MATVQDCGPKVSEFELQQRYFIHFWINILGNRVRKDRKYDILKKHYFNNSTWLQTKCIVCGLTLKQSPLKSEAHMDKEFIWII